jgi:hypothetical protein
MQCDKCGSKHVLTEGLLDGKVKVVCQECGQSNIKDSQGREMLTDDMSGGDRRQRLVEG